MKILGHQEKTVIETEMKVGTGKAIVGMKKIYAGGQEIEKQVKRIQNTDVRSLSSLTGKLRKLKQQQSLIRKYNIEIDKHGKKVKKLNGTWKELNRRAEIYKKAIANAGGDWMDKLQAKFPAIGQFQKLTKFMGPFVQAGQAAVMAFQAINQAVRPLIQRQKQVEGLSLAMKGFGLSTNDTAQILGASKQIAMEYGASLSNIEKGFKRITPAILQNGGSLKDTAQVMTAISARTTTLGLNTEQSGRYMEAFAQVMGKGKLQSEELNQQFSELDGALRGQLASAAKSMYGIEDLNAAMEAGAISSDMFQKMFVEVSKTMVDSLGGSLDEVQSRLDGLNVAQVENIVNNLNTLTMDSLRETLGGIGESFQRVWVAVSQFFAAITNNLPATKQMFTEVFDEIGVFVEIVVNSFLAGLQFLLKGLDEILGFLMRIRDELKNLPGFKELFSVGEAVGGWFVDSFRKGVDIILNTGDAVKDTVSKMDELDGRMKTLKNTYLTTGMSGEEFQRQLNELRKEMRIEENMPWIRTLQKKLADLKIKAKELDEVIKDLKATVEGLKIDFDREKEGIKQLVDAIKTKYKEEIRLSKEAEKAIKEKIKTEKDRTKEVKEAIKTRYNAEKQAIKDNFNAKMRSYDAEIAKLNQLSPAEKELQEMRRKELEDKTKNTNLSVKERLEAQASLDQMERQEKIAEINKKKKEEQLALQRQERALQEAKKKALQEEKDLHEKKLKALESQLETQENLSNKLKKDQDRYIKTLNDSVKKTDQIKVTLEEIPGLVAAQADQAERAARAYWDAADALKAQNAEKARNKAAQAKIEGDINTLQQGDMLPTNFAGGFLRGGEKTHINELGQEAFLTASGRLSMINAKPWDVWKAPTSGTVIPAHLTSQLDIPRGGVNINKKATISANTAANRGASMASVAKAIAGSMGNDVITNNVTVQSTNPTKTASDMLVQLTKLRRRRMY